MSSSSPEAPIFIVGYGRSGTSLLRVMLNAHPNIYIAQESGFYQWLHWDRLIRCTSARSWFLGYARTAWFKLLQLDPAPIAAAIPEELPRKAAGPRVLPLVLGAAALRFGRGRWGDKTPQHCRRLDAIFRDFPDARVIHVTRHPVATVGSILRMPWGSDSVLLTAMNYRSVTAAVARYAERVLVVRLEDLLEAPERELRRVLDHVGEPWDDRVLQHAKYAEVSRDPPLPWLTQAAAPVQRGERTAELSPAQVRLVERLTAASLRRYGYAPTALAAEPPLLERWRTWWADLPRALRYMGHLIRTIPPTDAPERIHALEQIRWLFQLNPSERVPPAWREIPTSLEKLLAD